MTELLPFDLTDIIHTELENQRRSPDGLLHPSTHLVGPLRHAMLDAGGAPKLRSNVVSEVTLMTGTMWHEWIGATLKRLGLPVMMEVNLTPWLPSGWAGTADLIVWNPHLNAWVLVDLKTQKGEGMRFIARSGAKQDHIIQTSAYWHAIRKMGLPLARAIGVYYLPKNDTRAKGDVVEPLLIDFAPIPAKELGLLMKGRGKSITGYLESLPSKKPAAPDQYDYWVTPKLADPEPREQKLYYDRVSGGHEVKLVPHWSTGYCPFHEDLCGCSRQSTEKIGSYAPDGEYIPRKGYEDIEPEVVPNG